MKKYWPYYVIPFFFFVFGFIGHYWGSQQNKPADRTVASFDDLGKRFVVKCPSNSLYGHNRIALPRAERLAGSVLLQPGAGMRTAVQDLWISNTRETTVGDQESAKFSSLSDGLDSGLATPQCFYEGNIRYVLNQRLLKNYSCFKHSHTQTICDRMD